jgi:hypothetical protein
MVTVYKDPTQFQLDKTNTDSVVLGLDLGTNCGYAIGLVRPNGDVDVEPWSMGLWDLSTGRYDTGNLGFLRLRRFLAMVSPTIVYYEDVKYTPEEAITRYNAARILARAATSSELIGAFKQTLCLWCEDHGAACLGIPIGTIKRMATGRGNANKEDMIRACNAKFRTNFDVETYSTTGADNVADAAFVLLAGIAELPPARQATNSVIGNTNGTQASNLRGGNDTRSE